MGLLKKKPDEPEEGALAAVEDAPEELASAEAANDPATPDTSAPVEQTAEPASEAATPEGDDASDALLSMFHAADEGAGDREILLQMAGEVELPDLVDQLRTVAAALSIASARGR